METTEIKPLEALEQVWFAIRLLDMYCVYKGKDPDNIYMDKWECWISNSDEKVWMIEYSMGEAYNKRQPTLEEVLYSVCEDWLSAGWPEPSAEELEFNVGGFEEAEEESAGEVYAVIRGNARGVEGLMGKERFEACMTCLEKGWWTGEHLKDIEQAAKQ